MAKIIVKCGYMSKSNKKRGGFLEYIATRDGVIKNLKSITNKKTTKRQKEYIEKAMIDIKGVADLEEYKTYTENKTIGNASELITKIEETQMLNSNNADEYLKYIAERPRVAKEDSHGLFSSADKINLSQTIEEVAEHQGNVWTAIVSLKREDATRLGYDNLNAWKTLIRSKQNEMARSLDIYENNFKWYAAFHDEGQHPHVHIVMYSIDKNEGYMKEKSINKIRSVFGNEIFKDELLHVFTEQTRVRDQTKEVARDKLLERIKEINEMATMNDTVDQKLVDLAERLKNTKGRKQYGYLSKGLKEMIDGIVDDLSEDQTVKQLIDEWYTLDRTQENATVIGLNEEVHSYGVELIKIGDEKVITGLNESVVVKVAETVEKIAYLDYGYSSDIAYGLGYNSQMQDTTGLIYLRARYYDPMVSRFISIDNNYKGETKDILSHNRYAYTLNNPYKYVDIDGNRSVIDNALEALSDAWDWISGVEETFQKTTTADKDSKAIAFQKNEVSKTSNILESGTTKSLQNSTISKEDVKVEVVRPQKVLVCPEETKEPVDIGTSILDFI